jgi:putative addiction module CopG family antidote
MVVQLVAHLEAAIRQKVESGLYPDSNAVIREALRLIDEHDQLVWLRAAVAEADAQFERGDYEEWTPAFLDTLSREADEMARQGLAPHADVCP